MSNWQTHQQQETALRKIDEQLANSPKNIDLLFDRAVTLNELGRSEEAKNAYIELLKQDHTHFAGLNNLGALLMDTGYTSAAHTAYSEAVKQHPANPMGHINLANALAKDEEFEQAIQHFETAIKLDPNHYEAHQGLSHLLTDIGQEERAAIHRAKGFKDRPIMLIPYRGKNQPIALLVLASAAGGTVPLRHHLDTTIFYTSVLFVDFYDPELPFPPHHLVFNAVGDADVSKPSLEAAIRVLGRTKAPVINHPAKIMVTGRAENAKRFATIPGVITPKMELLPRQLLASPDAAAHLAKRGFTFPLLLRSPGFHTGRFFVKVDDASQLAEILPSLPKQELVVIQYINAKSADGKIRKYRVMMIDGELYPLHAAISHEWKIHYFSAEMADNLQNRAEDAAFLADMPKVLGPSAMQALKDIRDMLGLDYAGADFSLNQKGEIILFEANATMVVKQPDPDPRWDYRRPAVQRILDAVRRMLTKNAA